MNNIFKDDNQFWKTIYPKSQTYRVSAKKLIMKYIRLSKMNRDRSSLWSNFYSEGSQGKYIHGKIGEYLKNIQIDYCCYCQEKILHNKNFNIDHVLPRQIYPQFSFKMENFAAACITCNAIKTNNDWFKLPIPSDYPKQATALACYHPNLHNFNDHIDMICIQSNRIYLRAYSGKTNKGKALVEKHLKSLCIYSAKTMGSPNVATAIENLTIFLGKTAGEKNDIKNFISKIIKHI